MTRGVEPNSSKLVWLQEALLRIDLSHTTREARDLILPQVFQRVSAALASQPHNQHLNMLFGLVQNLMRK